VGVIEKEFAGKLGNYKVLATEDNTHTVYSEYFDEACHNLSGAYAETLHNYIQGCSVPALFNQNKNFAVLDVGFGVGVGLKALLDTIPESFTSLLSYYSIELDEELFLWSVKQTLPEISFLKKVEKNLIYFEAVLPRTVMRVFIGDGRLTLPLALKSGLLTSLDAIFQDAFSPKKNPALWTVEWFSFLKSVSNREVQLSTYSSSISIRKSLIRAGWGVQNAQGFAMKRSMTKASFAIITSEEMMEQLNRSPTLEIQDSDLSSST
jgi:tRNA U34 5-methylaminomethyl-2-thiouridine-forming methyltransferase MnmC